jgi:hypothetical protein
LSNHKGRKDILFFVLWAATEEDVADSALRRYGRLDLDERCNAGHEGCISRGGTPGKDAGRGIKGKARRTVRVEVSIMIDLDDHGPRLPCAERKRQASQDEAAIARFMN